MLMPSLKVWIVSKLQKKVIWAKEENINALPMHIMLFFNYHHIYLIVLQTGTFLQRGQFVPNKGGQKAKHRCKIFKYWQEDVWNAGSVNAQFNFYFRHTQATIVIALTNLFLQIQIQIYCLRRTIELGMNLFTTSFILL